ncbi:MAG: hypothetical protein OXN89_13215 [Bryobacterales bacterium]|nr:hypothetical protein [Bryobacterales bacterium]
MAHGCSGALREIGLDHHMQAEQTGWVLYLNGPGDLAVPQPIAGQLGHDVPIEVLRRPFVH